MLNSIILSYIIFVYFGAFVLYLLMMVMGKELLGRLATFVSLAGLVVHSMAIILRWIESHNLGFGHAPFSNLYESLIFFAWTVIFLYLIVEWRTKNRSLGAFVTPLAFLAMAYASYSPDVSSRIQPLIPALKSNWLITHVITCFFGYAAFGLSFGLSLMYLLKRFDSQDRKNVFLKLLPQSETLDELNYQMVVIGFLMLTLGIITGSVWADSAWGSYWSWDPKENWALIVWLFFAAYIHGRTIGKWKDTTASWIVVAGFIMLLICYFGVNLYFPGLHSYATE